MNDARPGVGFRPPALPRVLPAGTRVVLRRGLLGDDGAPRPAGAAAVVDDAPLDPAYSYQLRFADGGRAAAKRGEFDVLAHALALAAGGEARLAEGGLFGRVVLRVVVGSRAYGLDDDDSDVDRRGVYLAPAELHWSLWGIAEQVENAATQEHYWELGRLLVLALKSNPTATECLWSPLVEHATGLGRELVGLRGALVSRLAYATFGGYAQSQFEKLQADVRTRGLAKPKHVMHLLRLLMSGRELLRTGQLPLRVPDGPERDRLMAIKRGELPFAECERWRVELQRAFDDAYAETKLPERPDVDAANAFLIRARRLAAQSEDVP